MSISKKKNFISSEIELKKISIKTQPKIHLALEISLPIFNEDCGYFLEQRYDPKGKPVSEKSAILGKRMLCPNARPNSPRGENNGANWHVQASPRQGVQGQSMEKTTTWVLDRAGTAGKQRDMGKRHNMTTTDW